MNIGQFQCLLLRSPSLLRVLFSYLNTDLIAIKFKVVNNSQLQIFFQISKVFNYQKLKGLK